jgi:glycosyltransferase involved in cell wall biosynthesis
MLSVLIPAYNEAAYISETINDLKGVLDRSDIVYEIIVIDDGSEDETAARAEETGVRVICHPQNGGYGRAIKTGLFNAQYEWCAIIDADGTYPVERMRDLLDYIPGYDMVIGARTGKHYWGTLGKRISRKMLLLMVAYVIGTYIPDVNSGMRIFRKRLALEHIEHISSGFSFTTTLTLATFQGEYFVRFVPIEYYPRVGNSKVRLGIDSLRMLQILVHSIIYYNPLKLFLLLCIASILLGIALSAATLLWGHSPGVSWVIFALSGMTALILAGLGFITEAIRSARDS